MASWLVVVSIACAACGKRAALDDAAPSTEPLPSIDAATLPPCANPVRGTKVVARAINPQRLRGIATIATSPPLDPRLFVVRIDGTIWIFEDEVMRATPFLDLSADAGGPVATGNEMGLLGLAFHPAYTTTGTFFVYYTTGDLAAGTLRNVVARCQVDANDRNHADPASCREVLAIADPATNHNAGMLEFASDGMLYIATGDGGGPDGRPRGQDTSLLLGKILRVDVDGGTPYAIPVDNPFATSGGGERPEIWMYGLRNPWRFAIDPINGDMWIGDVGQSAIEELDWVPRARQPGANLGWGMYEGSRCPVAPCIADDKVFPVDERTHGGDGWTAIIGGDVYRGTCYPDLVGWYFYTDVARGGLLIRARPRGDGTVEIVDLADPSFPARPTSLHHDARGELYLTDILGFVFHLEVQP